MHTVTVRRANGKNTSEVKIECQIDYLVNVALRGPRGNKWKLLKREKKTPYQKDGLWVYTYTLFFERIGKSKPEIVQTQWEQLTDMISKAGWGTRFGEYKWKIVDEEDTPTTESDKLALKEETVEKTKEKSVKEDHGIKKLPDVMEFIVPDTILGWEDLKIQPELLSSSYDINQSPAFADIYDLAPQIRTLLSAIEAGIASQGHRRLHTVLFGEPGCGKTMVNLAIEKFFGPGSVLRLDATSTTRAGLEKLFFKQLKKIPPIVICEEIEKAKEEWLQIWLGALDDRGEIRKVNYRECHVRRLKVVFICTANDKDHFDRMMGGVDKKEGALSSRCVNQIYFPRPSSDTLRKILRNDIRLKGGKEEYIEPCIELAKKLGTNDPRRVASFLAGGDRLLNNEYQQDRLAIHKAATSKE